MIALLMYLMAVIIGYFIGRGARKKGLNFFWTGTVQTVAIILLVFFMGSRIGSNEEVVDSLDSIGLYALIITIIIDIFSVLMVSISRRVLGFNRFGVRSVGSVAADQVEENKQESGKGGVNRMTIYICASVAVGIISGYLFLPQSFIDITGTLITVSLCILLLFVGIDIGTEGTLGENFRAAGWRVVVFPIAAFVGMIMGAIVCAMFLPLSLQDSLCVGAGFGWYSLGPAMLASYSLQISAISFMHNVMRELISILFIPIVAKKIGYIECICLPGAAAMDVCLPIVERATRSDVAIYSFISGAVLSASVPLLTGLFMSI